MFTLQLRTIHAPHKTWLKEQIVWRCFVAAVAAFHTLLSESRNRIGGV